MQFLDDTIAAIATPFGVGGVGVVRVSGPDSYKLAKAISQKTELTSNYAYHVWLKNMIDEAVVTVFKSPNSFTGEDVLEISCHGSPLILNNVLSELFKMGARQAERGEFSKRAFLNGKIDLIEAEAILAIATAKTEASSRVAAEHLSGKLSKGIEAIKNECVALLSEIQAEIDFPDDVKTRNTIAEELEEISNNIDEILRTAKHGMILRRGANVVIAGQPNVGKSSLLNALLKEPRAIVTELPGTTRDAIIESVNIKGLAINLIDVAGIMDAGNVVEMESQRLAEEYMNKADLILLIVDASDDRGGEYLLRGVVDNPHLIVVNKIDLEKKTIIEGVEVSALNGTGIGDLEDKIYSFFNEAQSVQDCVITSERQEECLKRANMALKSAKEAVKMGEGEEIVAAEIQAAVSFLGEMIGTKVSDQIIERIFSEFCVGK